MVLRAQLDAAGNPPVGCPQEQFGVVELAGTARINLADSKMIMRSGVSPTGDRYSHFSAAGHGAPSLPVWLQRGLICCWRR